MPAAPPRAYGVLDDLAQDDQRGPVPGPSAGRQPRALVLLKLAWHEAVGQREAAARPPPASASTMLGSTSTRGRPARNSAAMACSRQRRPRAPGRRRRRSPHVGNGGPGEGGGAHMRSRNASWATPQRAQRRGCAWTRNRRASGRARWPRAGALRERAQRRRVLGVHDVGPCSPGARERARGTQPLAPGASGARRPSWPVRGWWSDRTWWPAPRPGQRARRPRPRPRAAGTPAGQAIFFRLRDATGAAPRQLPQWPPTVALHHRAARFAPSARALRPGQPPIAGPGHGLFRDVQPLRPRAICERMAGIVTWAGRKPCTRTPSGRPVEAQAPAGRAVS
jgi:hypothetical protein